MRKDAGRVKIDLTGLLKAPASPSIFEDRGDSISEAFRLMEEDENAGCMDFTRLPFDRESIASTLELANKLRPGLEDVIVCGIGGSALGFLALTNALLHPRYNELPAKKRGGPRWHMLDNADAEALHACLDIANLKKSLIVLISKSGGGGETIANFLSVIAPLVRLRGGDWKKAMRQVVAITDPHKGPLRRVVSEYGLASLPVPPCVGGRFSVLSPVGLFPAALLGMDASALLAGAADMLGRCRGKNAQKNPAMTAALLLDEHARAGRTTTVMMPYANSLWRSADWFRQLWAESLGKARNRRGEAVHVGLTPAAALGATDQHSQVQLYAEGPDDKTYFFLRTKARADAKMPDPPFEEEAYGFLGGRTMDTLLNIEGDATESALEYFGRPTARITLPGTTPHALGQLFMFLEMTTACLGALWNIDAFNQPGVELGKILTQYRMGVKAAGEKVIDAKTGLKAKDILKNKSRKSGSRLRF